MPDPLEPKEANLHNELIAPPDRVILPLSLLYSLSATWKNYKEEADRNPRASVAANAYESVISLIGTEDKRVLENHNKLRQAMMLDPI